MKSKFFVMVFAVLMVFSIGAMVITYETEAAVSGDSNMRTRYSTVSTTPISDLNQLNGVTSNVQTQLDATTSSTLADTKVNVGSAAGTASPQSLTISGDMTAAMDNSGDFAGTLAANSVSVSQFGPMNTVTLNVAAGTVGNSVAVESGSLLISVFPRTGFSNDYTMTNSVYSGGSLIVNTDAHPADMTVDALFLRP